MNAIIFTTNTGSTERYAKLLAQKTGLPAYSLAEAKKRVLAGAEVIYLGWIMAGSVKGYAEAAKRYQVRTVCAVGMGQTGTQADSVRKKSGIPADIPLFTLQGNFDENIFSCSYSALLSFCSGGFSRTKGRRGATAHGKKVP